MIRVYPNAPDAYKPLIELIGDYLLKASEVAEHLRYSEQHLANMRRAGNKTFMPWIALPGGAIRYRMADVVAAQIGGTTGPLTLDRVNLAIATCRDVTPEVKLLMQEHLRKAFVPTGTD
ncbi:MAG: hypothetical protein C0519_01340 [Hyphomicrobium sp.]|nr:hypothetical protein [Hyphomicrobium sp.]PPD09559.1 MAG: hypothetical protein CTY28_01765 [Hyphomicrobium sp.]